MHILYHHHQLNLCMGYIGLLLKSQRPVLADICTRTYLFSEKRLKDILTSSSFEMKCLLCKNVLIYVHNIRCYDPKSTLSH